MKRKNLKKMYKLKNKTTLIIAIVMVVVLSGVVLGRTGILNKLFTHNAFLETGYSTEVKTVTGTGPGFAEGNAGSFSVTKSAEWTDRLEATINLTFDTKEIKRNTNRDIILVLDVSESMDQERIDTLKTAVNSLTTELFATSNNRLAIITFGSTSNINTGFTNDKTVIDNIMNNLEIKGATNYYLALKDVETLLSSYTRRTNTDLHMIFVTDGYVSEGTGLYEEQYKKLKNKYYYMLSTGIQFEMGDDIALDVKKISDYQYYSFLHNTYGNKDLESVLLDAARDAEYYNEVVITDFIYDDYFTIDPNQYVDVPFGSISITNNNNVQKIVWNIPKNKVKSGSNIKYYIEFKIKLKEQYSTTEAYFPTNESLTLNAVANGISNYSMTMTDTPTLKSWFVVTYNPNVPAGCSTTYVNDGKYFPYDTVRITDTKLSCLGSQFKGWEVNSDDAVILSDDAFVMPAHDTEIGAKWTSLSIDKSMIGTINKRMTLYQTLASNAIMDNVKSQFATSFSGVSFHNISSDTNGKGLYTDSATKNDTYPVRYFRGNVIDNNVLFGNYCWKIVRTTPTGGIKMVYNGAASGGKCTATGANTTIGQSAYNSSTKTYEYSLAYTGYMYGAEYETNLIHLGADEWGEIAGIQAYRTTYKYGNSFVFGTPSFDGTNFRISGSSVAIGPNAVGKYTIFASGTNYISKTLAYVESVDSSSGNYVLVQFTVDDYQEFVNSVSDTNLKNIYQYFKAKAQNTTWIYGHDVDYSNGVYTLKDTISLKPIDYGNNISIMNGDVKRHYTCMTNGTTCSKVFYFFADVEEYMLGSYIEVSGGKVIDDYLAEMTGETTLNKDSDMKTFVDNWFIGSGLNTTTSLNMLEDTVWCNNKKPMSKAGWVIDGSTSEESLRFTEWYLYEPVYTCDLEDSYTVNTANGNGALAYPVGMLTTTDYLYAGANYDTANTNFYLNNGVNTYTFSPAFYNNLVSYYTSVRPDGSPYYFIASDAAYVRPAVSLKPGVYVADGDGTQLNPYVIEMS